MCRKRDDYHTEYYRRLHVLVSQKVLTCDKGFFEGEMDDIPVGQYTVKLELLNHENKVICSQEIKHIAVGDLYWDLLLRFLARLKYRVRYDIILPIGLFNTTRAMLY